MKIEYANLNFVHVSPREEIATGKLETGITYKICHLRGSPEYWEIEFFDGSSPLDSNWFSRPKDLEECINHYNTSLQAYGPPN